MAEMTDILTGQQQAVVGRMRGDGWTLKGVLCLPPEADWRQAADKPAADPEMGGLVRLVFARARETVLIDADAEGREREAVASEPLAVEE